MSMASRSKKKSNLSIPDCDVLGDNIIDEEDALPDGHVLVDNIIDEEDALGSSLSLFEDSIENHFCVIDKLYDICGASTSVSCQEDEFDHLYNSVTFLREWRHFSCRPRKIRFSSETKSLPSATVDEISLPQFASAQVPKSEFPTNEAVSTPSRSDFVLYVGGAVWALDWCPRQDLRPGFINTCEFIAISAHPPDSAYHKLGSPLSGHGMVQIWCLLNSKDSNEDVGKKDVREKKGPRGRPRKYPKSTTSSPPYYKEQCDRKLAIEYPQSPLNVEVPPSNPGGDSKKDVEKKKDDSQPKRPRGTLKKNPINTVSFQLNCNKQCHRALAIEYSQGPLNVIVATSKPGSELTKSERKKKNDSQPKRSRGQQRKNPINTTSSHPDCKDHGVEAFAIEDQQNLSNAPSLVKEQNFPVPTEPNDKSVETRLTKGCKDRVKRPRGQPRKKSASPASDSQNGDHQSIGTQASSSSSVIPLLPKVVLCIGHDGKVAWDVKWRPCGDSYSKCHGRLGYVAVVLGNGSLEVWDIPSPKTMKLVYLSQPDEGIDPRFVKLKPVFRCAMLKCGDRQSMPMTVEWSTSSPHNLILAGCHDGMVALWKFSVSDSSKDTRPLLFFSADTVPIRAISWAPSESDPESANVIVTAGHEGMKFWDIRDPFHPLWDIAAQRFIYSIDWLPDPRCVLTSYDDGTLRILSISKAANDAPVTGKAYSGTPLQGLHSYYCSSFAIWSVHTSRHTGLVAYCGADGMIRYFQLTHKAVDKDPARNRAPHFLCGSLSEEDGNVTVNISSANTPCPMKRSVNEWGNTPQSLRGFVNSSNVARRTKAVAKKQKLDDDQALVVCDGDDANMDQPLANMLKNIKTRKLKLNQSKKNDKGTTDLTESSEKPNIDQDVEVATKFELMPSKMVAMHRVRWNMNKGSERWLCYGGASGIIRCQEIIPTVFDKKALKAWRS